MRLDPSTGLAVWSSDSCWQGSPDGQIAVLDPRAGNSAAWFKIGEVGRHVPDDYSDPEHKPWHVQTLAGERLLGDWPFNRMGGGVAAGSNNSSGQIRWADGRLQDFTGRVLFVSAEGIVGITDPDHQSVALWNTLGLLDSKSFDAPIAQGNQSEPDQLDCAFVGRILSVRTTRTLLFLYDSALQPISYVPNDASRTTIPIFTRTGQLWLCEWNTVTVTARPYTSALGIVVLANDQEHQFYLDSTISFDDLILVYSYGAGQQRADYRAVLVNNYESLPRVDVLTPPIVPALPMPVAPLPPLTNLWYFAYHHADWNQPGGPFPDIDQALRCDAIYGLSDDEISYALSLGKPCIITFDQAVTWAEPLHAKGLLWAFVARNENGADLQAQVDALEPLCVQYDRPMVVYNDGGMEKWPTRWPRYAVASVKCYFEAYEPIDQWRTRSRAIVRQFQASFPTVPIDLCYSAFDRNVTGWTPETLSNLQVVASELAHEFS